jgi:PAS domain-containing protein
LIFPDVIVKREGKQHEIFPIHLELLMHNRLDNDLKIFFWNKGAERMFGYTKEETMGEILSS